MRLALFGLGALGTAFFVLSPKGAIGQTVYTPPSAPGYEAATPVANRIGRVSLVSGDVSYFAESMTPAQWIRAELNLPVPSRASLAVGDSGHAEATFGITTVHLDRQSQADFADVDERLSIGVTRGAIALSVPAANADDTIVAFGSNWRMMPRQPGTYTVRVEPTGDVVVKVHSGVADVEWDANTVSVEAGREVRLTRGDRIVEVTIDDDAFDRWVLDRARQIAALHAPASVSPSLTGAEVLSQYGDWSQAAGYGSIWYPRVVAGWEPYRAGRWVTLAPWGRLWVDAQPWGFATSHYGRWVRFDGRWGWVPGEHAVRPVFAPSRIVLPVPVPPPRVYVWERPRFAPPPPRYVVPPVVIAPPRGGIGHPWPDRGHRPDRPFDRAPIGSPPVHIEPPRAVVPPIRFEPPRFDPRPIAAPPVRIEPPRPIGSPPVHIEPPRRVSPPPMHAEPPRMPGPRIEPRPIASPPRWDPPRPIAPPPSRVEVPQRPMPPAAPGPVTKPMPGPAPVQAGAHGGPNPGRFLKN